MRAAGRAAPGRGGARRQPARPARVNRLAGGAALSRRAIAALLREQTAASRDGSAATGPARLLDVGTGAADIPEELLRTWRDPRPLEIVATDSRPEVLEAAIRVRPALDGHPRLTLAVADGRALPYADAAFDVAHASMVLHHLDPDDAVQFLAELRRVSRTGVVVNDLARGRLRWLVAWLLLHATTRNRLTLNDGPLSVRRAYTPAEAKALLERAGLRVVHLEHGLARHRWAVAAVPGEHDRSVEVAVVGGGPAGAVAGMLLARSGMEVVAAGARPRVALAGVRRVHLAGDGRRAPRHRRRRRGPRARRAAHPGDAGRDPARARAFALRYGGSGIARGSPVGLDRSALDPLLLAMAAGAGAEVRTGRRGRNGRACRRRWGRGENAR